MPSMSEFVERFNREGGVVPPAQSRSSGVDVEADAGSQ
jgi:hypothetical protein